MSHLVNYIKSNQMDRTICFNIENFSGKVIHIIISENNINSSATGMYFSDRTLFPARDFDNEQNV